MRKLKYLISCLFRMNFGRMFKTIRRIAVENRKFTGFVFFDVLWCGLRYGAGYVDYLIFDFVNLPGKVRKTFVTRGKNNEFIRVLNNKDEYYKFEDKSVFNEIFKEYIGRDWLLLKNADEKAFDAFADKLGDVDVIVKPVDAICGKGIQKLPLSECRALLGENLLVEECVVQHKALADINASSVNTIRIMTVVKDGEVHIMFRALRCGIAGSVVDNFNAGGMFVLLDENGVIKSDAINKNTDIFERHPSSGIVFKGYQLPFFAEVENMIKRAALVVDGIRYVSWDIAVTDNGAVLIEGNHNPGYDLLQSKVYLREHRYGRLSDFEKVVL